MIKMKLKKCKIIFIFVAFTLPIVLYSALWIINIRGFSQQVREYEQASHNAWYKLEDNYIYTLTIPAYPSMKGCYVVSDENDTISIFIWKTSFLDSYEVGLEVFDEITGVSYQFMTDSKFNPEEKSMECFSDEEKEEILRLLKKNKRIIQLEKQLIMREWGI